MGRSPGPFGTRSGSGAPSKKRKLEPGPEQVPENSQRYHGSLKGYSNKDAYGFISCSELKKQYNADVYIHKNVFEQVMPPLQVGEQVEFSIHLNAKKQPQACFVSRAQPLQGEPKFFFDI